MDVELDFEAVRRHWLAAGGKNTLGILDAFEPAVVRWVESEVPAYQVAELRFIGAEGGGQWGADTGGSGRVGDLRDVEPRPGFRWDSGWRLVAVRDPESGGRVLIDGNGRAKELQLAVAAGTNPLPGDRSDHHRRRAPAVRLRRQGPLIALAVTQLWCSSVSRFGQPGFADLPRASPTRPLRVRWTDGVAAAMTIRVSRYYAGTEAQAQ